MKNWGFRCTLTRLSPSSEGTLHLPEMAMPLMDAEQMKTSTCHLTDCCKPTELEKRCFSVCSLLVYPAVTHAGFLMQDPWGFLLFTLYHGGLSSFTLCHGYFLYSHSTMGISALSHSAMGISPISHSAMAVSYTHLTLPTSGRV